MSDGSHIRRAREDSRQPRQPLGRRAAQKVNLILDAALTVFQETGYAAATIDAIAQEANTSRASVYTYFKSKRDILIRLGVRGNEQLQQIGQAFQSVDLDDDDQVKAWTLEFFGFFESDSALAFVWRDAAQNDEILRREGLFQTRNVWWRIGSKITSPESSDEQMLIRGMIVDAAVELSWYFSERFGAGFDRDLLASELARMIMALARSDVPVPLSSAGPASATTPTPTSTTHLPRTQSMQI